MNDNNTNSNMNIPMVQSEVFIGSTIEQIDGLDYFDLNAQILHLLLFRNKNFITNALLFDEICEFLERSLPIYKFSRVNLNNYRDYSLDELILAFSMNDGQWDRIKVLLLENLTQNQLKELNGLSNIRFIGFMAKEEFDAVWNHAEQYAKLIFLDYSSSKVRNFTFGSLTSEQELVDYYIQYGSFATADRILEMKEQANTIHELYLQKGKDAENAIHEFNQNKQFDNDSFASLLKFAESFYDLREGCLDFFIPKFAKSDGEIEHREFHDLDKANSEKKIILSSTQTEEDPVKSREVIMKLDDIVKSEEGKKEMNIMEGLEGFIAIWNEELGPLVIDQYPAQSSIEKETLAIQFFMTFEAVFGQAPMRSIELTLPLAQFNKIAIIHLDLLKNDSVRGGQQPYIISVLVPESLSQQQINALKAPIEERMKAFKTDHLSDSESLLHIITEQLNLPLKKSKESEILFDSVYSEKEIAIDLSNEPKTLSNIEKEIRTLNELNKVPEPTKEKGIPPIDHKSLKRERPKGSKKKVINKIKPEVLFQIKELVNLPLPNIQDIRQIEQWFEAKERMLRLFFESGII